VAPCFVARPTAIRTTLFFECLAGTGGEGLTDPRVDVATRVARAIGMVPDEDELRLGVAVTRGLLIYVLASDDATAATRSSDLSRCGISERTDRSERARMPPTR
jgi:hypothetical protein